MAAQATATSSKQHDLENASPLRLAAAAASRIRLTRMVASWDVRHLFLIGLAIELGAIVRLFFVTTADFPVLDGGLFYTMIQNLRSAHYLLPAYTSYNSTHIPFVYPPLAFYAAGLLSDLSGWSTLDVIRLWPAAMSILTIPVFYRLARHLLRSRSQATFAVFAFALVPRSFNWEIVGGGLTRSTGFLLALLTLHQAYLLYIQPKKRHLVLATVFGAGVLATHVEMALFATVGAVLLLIFQGRNRRALFHALAVAAGVAALTAPWWATVLRTHGLSPWLAASHTAQHGWFAGLSLALFDFTDEPYLALIGALGLIGLAVAVARLDYLLPLWVVVTFVLDPRKAPTTAMVPLTMLAAIALFTVILPALNPTDSSWPSLKKRAGTEGARAGSNDRTRQFRTSWGGALGKAVTAFIILHAFVSTIMAPYTDQVSPVRTLSAGHRGAMAWLRSATPDSATFAVVSETDLWAIDQISEWFPTLAQRRSVGTVQGNEWLPGFEQRITEYEALQACAVADSSCLEQWAEETRRTFSHVYVAKSNRTLANSQRPDCCAALRQSLQRSSDFTLLYENDAAAVFARRISTPFGTPSDTPSH